MVLGKPPFSLYDSLSRGSELLRKKYLKYSSRGRGQFFTRRSSLWANVAVILTWACFSSGVRVECMLAPSHLHVALHPYSILEDLPQTSWRS